jgi:hypothetical protein
MVGRGMTYQQIADECVLDRGTVHNTITSARQRLGGVSTIQALLIAIAREELGLTHDGICFLPIERPQSEDPDEQDPHSGNAEEELRSAAVA